MGWGQFNIHFFKYLVDASNEFTMHIAIQCLKTFVNAHQYTSFINLKYNVQNALIPKFSYSGYYIFMSINSDVGLLKSIAPCNYNAALWYL